MVNDPWFSKSIFALDTFTVPFICKSVVYEKLNVATAFRDQMLFSVFAEFLWDVYLSFTMQRAEKNGGLNSVLNFELRTEKDTELNTGPNAELLGGKYCFPGDFFGMAAEKVVQ